MITLTQATKILMIERGTCESELTYGVGNHHTEQLADAISVVLNETGKKKVSMNLSEAIEILKAERGVVELGLSNDLGDITAKQFGEAVTVVLDEIEIYIKAGLDDALIKTRMNDALQGFY